MAYTKPKNALVGKEAQCLKKNLLPILGVVLILAGVTTGYATEYEERWDGWFDTGTLYYNSVSYTLVGEATATVYDTTYSVSIDTFYYITQPALFLFISADNDSIRLSITVFRGYKGTGTSGTKEGTGGGTNSGQRTYYREL